jgi:hypothetical protein
MLACRSSLLSPESLNVQWGVRGGLGEKYVDLRRIQ